MPKQQLNSAKLFLEANCFAYAKIELMLCKNVIILTYSASYLMVVFAQIARTVMFCKRMMHQVI